MIIFILLQYPIDRSLSHSDWFVL